MNVVSRLVIPVLLLLISASCTETAAQSSTKAPVSTAKPTAASAKCHALLGQFEGKDADFFSRMTDDELSRASDSIFNCVAFSYAALSRFDLFVAATAGTMVARELQSREDKKVYEPLLRELTEHQTPKPSNARTVTLAISPLPNGFTRTLTVMGHENTCVAVESMRLMCTINEGPANAIKIPVYLVAMIAPPKPLPMFEHSFLMGCNPDLSNNCSTLVPGEYTAEYVGTDGVSVEGLVAEDKPNAPPHHGVYTIYRKGQLEFDPRPAPSGPSSSQSETATSKERSTSRVGSVDVTSSPEGAEILIDGASTDQVTPARVQVRPGIHTLLLKLDGYESAKRTFQISEGGTLTVNQTLSPK